MPVETEVFTSPAPLESSVASTQPYTHVSHFVIGTAVSFSWTLAGMLKDDISGYGNVDLHSIVIDYEMPTEGLKILGGFCHAGTSLTVNQVAFKPNGLHRTSNARTAGEPYTAIMVPESTMSRQIQPVSSDLPMIKFMMEWSKGVCGQIHIFYKVHDHCQKFHTLNSI